MSLNRPSNELVLEVFRHVDAFSNPDFVSESPTDIVALYCVVGAFTTSPSRYLIPGAISRRRARLERGM